MSAPLRCVWLRTSRYRIGVGHTAGAKTRKAARKAYSRAHQPDIRHEIKDRLRNNGPINQAVAELTRLAREVIDKQVPPIEPSQYAKRWFTADVKQQHWQETQVR